MRGTIGIVWAESYDKTISDALTLQGELATEIASALRATLSPEEKAQVERKHTTIPDAYVLYLRARQLEINPDTLLQDFKAAVQLYGEAIKLDPSFALAHARLSATMSRIYHFYEPTAAWKERAQVRRAGIVASRSQTWAKGIMRSRADLLLAGDAIMRAR